MTATRLRIILGITVILASTGLAGAADLYLQPAPAPYSEFSWVGPYVGANAGYQWGAVSNSPTRPSGVEGGIGGGYNWQRGRFVFGVDGDINISGASATFAPWQFSNPWFGTVRGRGGFAISNVLLYGTLGMAFGDLRADSNLLTQDNVEVGWTGGAGVEVAFDRHWSAKAEYLYIDLLNRGFQVTGANNGLAANLVRLGVNYHF
jgi:outer membrane immunogenic protein